MLTADLVRATRKQGVLVLRSLSAKERVRAAEIGGAYLQMASGAIGKAREELETLWSSVPITPREKRLADGLRKLVEDASEFAVATVVDPMDARSAVFLAASAARAGGDFERSAVLAKVAEAQAITVQDLERSLYADLRAEETLLRTTSMRPEALVAEYERGQVAAVLLRAVRLVADVRCATPAAYRALFRKLKFHRLLYRISENPGGGYRIEIDGPYSLFEAVTKYGLELALVLPALEACDELDLAAEVRWGKDRSPLTFRHTHKGGTGRDASAPRLREAVEALVESLKATSSPFRVSEAKELLDLPGIGLCVPDLVFEDDSGARVYFEAMGFWSRDALWKRIELVKAGLDAPILFAASTRLRVSEAALGDEESAALYVYKGTMSPRAVLQKVAALVSRGSPKK